MSIPAPVTAPHPTGRVASGRAMGLLMLIGLVLFLLLFRVAYLQTVGRQQTLRVAERQQHQRQRLYARRGSIYDRNGIEMAGTVQTNACFVDPHFMIEVYQQDGRSSGDLAEAIARLARALGKDPAELSRTISDRHAARFVKVADPLDDATCDLVRAMALPGVGIAPSDDRHYPLGALASHILGGVGKRGQGLDGLELRFDELLRGSDGSLRSTRDAAHRPIAVAAVDYLPPRHGRHLVLTIDANIQLIAEQELAGACREFGAARGQVVVMDPRNGEVLALANYPTFDLEKNTAPVADRRNACLVSPYEPGSTLKPFIAGPALQWGVTRLDEVWPLDGSRYRTPYGRTITDVHAYGPLATWDGLVKSSNILMSMLGERMGNARLHQALAGWGFGRPTGIELPGEDGGRLNPLKRWTRYSTESVAQGYEVMVTPLQLCRAFAAYGNGGRLVRPTLIRGMLDAQGRLIPYDADAVELSPQAVDPDTALRMRRVLCDVVVRGTATKARSDAWNIFGKTGTAHISQGKAGYSPDKYTSSFLCGAPAESPRLVAAFIVHEPDKSLAHYGGAVAAPGAARMLERALTYLRASPSPELPPPPPGVAKVLYQYNANAYKQKSPRQLAAAE